MATECLFRDDSYLTDCEARIVALTDQGGIVLDRTIFYATSGGQPGDTGALTAGNLRIPVETAVYTDAAKTEIAHVPAAGSPALNVGDKVTASIDWDRRYARMRMHTALHLLSAVLPYSVTGGSVGDKEQFLDEFYRVAGYPDLYLLGADQAGRKQVQILNRRDDCCFGEAQHDAGRSGAAYEPAIRVYEKVVQQAVGPKRFRLVIDESAPRHMISEEAVRIMLREMR